MHRKESDSGRRLARSLVFGVPIACVIAAAVFGRPLFETNDDAALAMVGAGFGIAAEPDPHLIFSHAAYGLLLNLLSIVFGPQAHGVATLTAIGLSIGLSVGALHAQGNRDTVFLICAAAVGSVIFTSALLRPQFTTTATLLVSAATALHLATARSGFAGGRIALVLATAALGYMIRPHSALLVLVVLGPALAWLCIRAPANERSAHRRFLAGIIVVLLLLGLIDWAAYALDADWKEIPDYNRLRGLFIDYGRVPFVREAPEYVASGWSENDHAMFMSWFSDAPLFDSSIVSSIAARFALGGEALRFERIVDWVATPLHFPMLLILLAAQAALVLWPGQRRGAALLVLTGELAAISIMAVAGRPPLFRVWFSVSSAALLGLVFLLPRASVLRIGGRVRGALALACLIGCAAGVGQVIAEHRYNLARAALYRTKMEEAREAFGAKTIAWGQSLIFEWLVTPTAVHYPFPDVLMVPIGVFSRTPVAAGTLAKLGISDLSRTLCFDPDIRLVVAASIVENVPAFCQEHFGKDTAFELIFAHDRTEIYAPLNRTAPKGKIE